MPKRPRRGFLRGLDRFLWGLLLKAGCILLLVAFLFMGEYSYGGQFKVQYNTSFIKQSVIRVFTKNIGKALTSGAKFVIGKFI